MCFFFFFKQKTAYEVRIRDWSSDVCSSDLAEDNHELLDVLDVPALRTKHPLRIDSVAGDCNRGQVGEEVVEQDLLRRQRQERQQRRRQRHADHVAEIRAGRERDVLESVGEGPAPDRKSVVWRERVSVRVDLGGRRTIKKKKTQKTKYDRTRIENT